MSFELDNTELVADAVRVMDSLRMEICSPRRRTRSACDKFSLDFWLLFEAVRVNPDGPVCRDCARENSTPPKRACLSCASGDVDLVARASKPLGPAPLGVLVSASVRPRMIGSLRLSAS